MLKINKITSIKPMHLIYIILPIVFVSAMIIVDNFVNSNYTQSGINISYLGGNLPKTSVSSPPSVPQNFFAVSGPMGINLSWQQPASNGSAPNSNITNYFIYRGNATGTESLLTTISNRTFSYLDSNAIAGQIYFYVINAKNDIVPSLSGTNSSEINATAYSLYVAPTIHINAMISALNWSQCPWVNGTGIISNPYTIQNVMINANWNGTGIWIENTSAYFKINNCSIISAGLITNLTISDILINNSMNGIISNCQVNSSQYDGISIWNSQNIQINNNCCWNNTQMGIEIYNSQNCNLNMNNCSTSHQNGIDINLQSNNTNLISNICWNNSMYGINIIGSANCILTSNNCTNNTQCGIDVNSLPNCILTNNNCTNNTLGGIFANNATNCTFTWNICNFNQGSNANYAGIFIESSAFPYLANNICDGNAYYGIKLHNTSDNNTEINNTCCYNHDSGLDSSHPQNDIMRGNNCSFNLDNGIYLGYTNNAILLNNTCISNLGCGIHLDDGCINITIMQNIFSNNTMDGAYFEGGSFINFTQNTCSFNGYSGIYSYYTPNCYICWNTCNSNKGSNANYAGIFIESSAFPYLANNICDGNAYYGIKLHNTSNNNTEINNTCCYNRDTGLDSSHPQNDIMVGNNCSFNLDNGIYLGYTNNAILLNNTCISNLGCGIHLDDGCINITIMQNIFSNNTMDGAYFEGGSFINFTQNTCSFNGYSGIYSYYTPNCYICWNTCNSNKGSNANYAGIFIESSAFPYLANNICDGNAYYGIKLHNISNNNTEINNTCCYNHDSGLDSSHPQNDIMVGNNCSFNLDNGIYLGYTNNAILLNNTCISNLGCGIHLDDGCINITIMQNIFSNNTMDGAYFEGDSFNNYNNNYDWCINITIMQNIFSGNSYSGVEIDGGSNFTLAFNNITLNQNDGIELYDCSNGTISSNTIANNIDDGIYLYTSESSFTIILNFIIRSTTNPYENFGSYNIFTNNFIINILTGNLIIHSSLLTRQVGIFQFNMTNGWAPFTFLWNFGDNSSSSVSQNTTHIYNKTGTYNITLTITEADGQIDIFSTTINIGQNVPLSPNNFQVQNGYSGLILSWQLPSDNGDSPITGYIIEWGKVSGQENSQEIIGNTTSVVFSNLNTNQTYYFEVAAINHIGTGQFSPEASGMILSMTVPSAPQNFTASVGDSMLSLQWAAPANTGGSPVINYLLYRGTSNSTMQLIKVLDNNSTIYNDTELSNGVEYYYMIVAKNGIGNSIASYTNGTPILSNQSIQYTIHNINLSIGLVITFAIVGTVMIIGVPILRKYIRIRKAGLQ